MDDVIETPVDPRRYFEAAPVRQGAAAARPPVCLYLEVTNRCNLLCTTCPRTYVELEPPADMSWELFRRIVDQVPEVSRAVMHGVGEPMLVRNLPRMVRYLKDRGVYVLFNTNGTVLNEKNGRALVDAGLDELRVSLDASNAKSYLKVRGKDYFNRILKNVKAFRAMQEREGHARPRVSAWLTGLKETVEELPAFVRIAAEIGVKEVYLQRLVFFDHDTVGLAQPDQALFEQMAKDEAHYLEEAESVAKSLGLTFPTVARFPAASRRSRSTATRTTRSATPPRRACARSGTVRATSRSVTACCRIRRHRPARTAAFGGVSNAASRR
jgi:MoaA/NifB/PqqE/SkfB family radical SAM enzyme